MARSIGRPMAVLVLSDEERSYLERQVRRRRVARSISDRCRMILRCADGLTNKAAAAELGVHEHTVGKWRRRFLKERIEGLSDEPRPGRPRTLTDEQVAEVIERTLETTPADATHWSIRSMARESGLSHTTIRRIWAAFSVQPHRSETFKLSSDPLFVDKVRDIIGLYLSPPDRALVLCVDEKSQIQALDRSQPVLPMLGMVRLHRGDHVVDRATLESVHGRCPCVIEMAQLRIAPGQGQLAAFLQPERHSPVPDARDLGGAAVHEPQPGIVAGPADAVPGAKLDPFAAVNLRAAPASADFDRFPVDGRAVRAFEMHDPLAVIDAHDAPFLALFDPEALVGTVEGHHIAGRIVGAKRLLRVGIPLRDQPLRLQGRPSDAAFAGEAFADMAVDRLPQFMSRRHHPGTLARLRGELEPARRDRARDIVGLHLGDIGAQLLECLADFAREARLDGGLQVGSGRAPRPLHDLRCG